ncbi:MAG: hypothetical protein NTX57_10330 [Armatimonadetes bacterium]|nr:hypothetical protein [Armatimonadota bacterium]
MTTILDTGFTGFLMLSKDQVQELGATPVDLREMELADGTIRPVARYEVTLLWDGRPKTVFALVNEATKPLLGMKLLHRSLVTLELVVPAPPLDRVELARRFLESVAFPLAGFEKKLAGCVWAVCAKSDHLVDDLWRAAPKPTDWHAGYAGGALVSRPKRVRTSTSGCLVAYERLITFGEFIGALQQRAAREYEEILREARWEET